MVVWIKTFPFISKAWWYDLKHFVSSQKYNGLWHYVSSPKYIPFHLKRTMVSDHLFHLKSIWLNLKHFVSPQKYVVKFKTFCFTSRVWWFKTIRFISIVWFQTIRFISKVWWFMTFRFISFPAHVTSVFTLWTTEAAIAHSHGLAVQDPNVHVSAAVTLTGLAWPCMPSSLGDSEFWENHYAWCKQDIGHHLRMPFPTGLTSIVWRRSPTRTQPAAGTFGSACLC